jgi:hypothetical protein
MASRSFADVTGTLPAVPDAKAEIVRSIVKSKERIAANPERMAAANFLLTISSDHNIRMVLLSTVSLLISPQRPPQANVCTWKSSAFFSAGPDFHASQIAWLGA